MKKVSLGNIEVYQFEKVFKNMPVLHAITTRAGGVSTDLHVLGLNLGNRSDDDPQHVTANRHLLAEAMQVTDDRIIFPRQVHSNDYKIITANNYLEPVENVDAMITAEKNLALCTMSADCVPILVYDPVKEVIASIHAGWKGTANGIVNVVIEAMKKEFGCEPIHMLVGIGPCISAEIYEVGPEVVSLFEKNFANADRLISKRQGDKAHVNLWEANRTWLLEQGVPESHIETSDLCTYTNHDVFYSARYDKNRTGRFAGCILMQ